jgi:prepilin-type N-terminal cleavage/methylation domain-containing protein
MLRTFLKKNKKGFTLTELMIVVIIIGILTAIAIPIYSSVSTKAAQSANDDNVRTIESVITQLTAICDCEVSAIQISDEGVISGVKVSGTETVPNLSEFLKAWPDVPPKYAADVKYSVKNGIVLIGEMAAEIGKPYEELDPPAGGGAGGGEGGNGD